MSDLVQVSVFSGANTEAIDEPLDPQMHRTPPGEQRMTVRVASEPARAAIDLRKSSDRYRRR